MPREVKPSDVGRSLKAVLDSHGFGFQAAVIRKLQQIYDKYETWLPEVAEFPATVNGFDTRIDFIVRPQGTRFFLISECKRVNPALGHWCFVRTPFVRRGRRREHVFIEKVLVNFPDGNFSGTKSTTSSPCVLHATGNEYHLGFEIRDPTASGDASGSGGRKPLEEHAGQIFRGVNGVAELLGKINPQNTLGGLFPKMTSSVTYLMPAIFTTAKLWVSDVDLGSADITTGELPELPEAKEVKWLIWQHPVSPGLRHSLPRPPLGYEFDEILDPEFTRSVAVISHSGIDAFTQQFRAFWELYPERYR